ncbi:PQQ-dependent sugar dehydrogenase [Shewanella glacialipiscicola]|uniref:Glucose dehydrogenase n=1 Tax=Shewanella glacialipiscicola TaxID=614069 RepID=A0ABQ6J3B9_9GAMM|nr:PQQ-dependent sugar dehydrogenase [Shewanella glacialipiscicola]MCL1085227.1 PQQ-dependent sugar dehydrogenase [Shewanella glacialipiscicola]MCU7994683.1 PQQ-dependent sugar dehydrogenase [Shewanella glacialipiscicola]MCU8026154.1 PQQ-dependent sugar dehydrogenase [Shewanella glacialipiscicola]GIU05971.1 glucose dehydrogenase [Shewanella glacialipiscicola]GMA81437.1 glucose dehydrogenase [Shewanella glacialipiscicola]
MKRTTLTLALCLFTFQAEVYAEVTRAAPLNVKTEAGNIQIKTIAEGLENIWGMAFLPDGSMLVTERAGRMRIVSTAGEVGEPLTGLPPMYAKGQGGLLDVVLVPDFATSKKIYFSYSEPAEGEASSLNSTAVSFATLNGNKLENLTRVFSQQPKIDSSHHFGSRLVWAPDGTLFITLGDRYSEKDSAQTLDNHLGKVVRINADGSVPQNNPFVNMAGALPEIWSIGHRNIQGAAINPISKVLWTGEHGPQGGDELNIDQAAKNYGWPVITYGENYGGGKIGEGTHKTGMEQPVYKWVPSIATAGFMFYTGDKFPQWQNNILLASLKEKTLVRLVLDGDKIIKEERLLKTELGQRLRSVVQGPDGLIYLVTDEAKSKIYQISPQQS